MELYYPLGIFLLGMLSVFAFLAIFHSRNKEFPVATRCTNCGKYEAKGSELIFISWIKRDGSGTDDVSKVDMAHLNDSVFNLNSLSLTHETYIASEFNSYVVKLKK